MTPSGCGAPALTRITNLDDCVIPPPPDGQTPDGNLRNTHSRLMH
jgi:hypothetical protein